VMNLYVQARLPILVCIGAALWLFHRAMRSELRVLRIDSLEARFSGCGEAFLDALPARSPPS
jgi:hypothetical protein